MFFVVRYINYEEKTAFPYFLKLIQDKERPTDIGYSSNDYKEHHTDIDSKLNASRDLFIQHVHLKSQFQIKRKLLLNLTIF